MALGKAFIEVHADTKPFARELGKELGRILATVEKTVVKKQGEKIGDQVSASVGDGVRRNKSKTTSAVAETLEDTGNIFTKFTKGLVDTLDDGLSGLPSELKLVLGVALAGLLPIAASFGASLVTAVGAGIASGGTLLAAFQFEEVQDRFDAAIVNIRRSILGDGSTFVGPVLDVLDMVDERLTALAPQFQKTFAAGAKALGPLVDGVLGFVENFLPLFNASLAGVGEIADVIGQGVADLGTEFGLLFYTISQNSNTKEALQDLFTVVGDSVGVVTSLLDVFLDLYDVTKQIFLIGTVLPATFLEALQGTVTIGRKATDTTDAFGNAIKGTLVPLEAEDKALQEATKKLKDYTNATFEALDNEIDFEQNLDNLSASLKKNGDTLDITSPKGRENARVLQTLAKEAKAAYDAELILTGSQEAANAKYDEHTAKIYEVGKQFKLSKVEIDKLIVSLGSIPQPTVDLNTGKALSKLDQIIARYRELNRLTGFRPAEIGSDITGGYQYHGYADGGIFDKPTPGVFGEAGAEVIIPLTKPARAAELLDQSGLSGLAGGGDQTIIVYIGNEQVDAHIDRRVQQGVNQTARSMSYGSRGV